MPSRGHLQQRCGDGYQTDLRPKEVSRLSMTRRNSGCGGAGYQTPILSPTSPPAECFIFNHDAGTAVPLMRQYGCSACHLLDFVLCPLLAASGHFGSACLLPEKFWLCVSLSFLGLASSGWLEGMRMHVMCRCVDTSRCRRRCETLVSSATSHARFPDPAAAFVHQIHKLVQ